MLNAVLMILMLFGLAACQPSESEDDGEHLLQDYEDALDRERDARDEIEQVAERQRRAIEDQDG